MQHALFTVLASPKRRYLAVFIDASIIAFLLLPMVFYTADFRSGLVEPEWWMVWMIFAYKTIIYLLVDVVIPASSNGKTIGRYFAQIRMIRRDGRSAVVSNYALRAAIFIAITLICDILMQTTISYLLWALVVVLSVYLMHADDHRMTIHDKVAGTMLIQDLHASCHKVN